ncbi:MAG: aromatic ring-hydroxylating dioxygenase subunit alpha [Parvularculaceae bacterium]
MTTLIDNRPATMDVASLVEPDRVHRSVYTDPRVFDLEMERIWHRTWIYVGHESQVKEPGQYYATSIGKQPVLLTRHADGNFYVLYNRCAHKGALLVGDRCGKLKELRCCYHGWRFDFDGKLLGIPLEQGYDDTRFNRDGEEANMSRAARAESYRGFVFASLSPDAPDLKTWLGGVASSIDNMVDRAPDGELEVTGGVLRYEHDCNWKFFVENLNDMMHPMVAHQSSSLTARVVAKKELPAEAPVPSAIEIIAPFTESYSFFDDMGVHAFDHGHGYSGGKTSIHAKYSEVPEYNKRMEAAYGKERVEEIFSVNRHNTIFYPSATIKGAIQTMRVVRPVAVDKTIIESWTFRLKGAPEELLQRSILYCNLINSSANLVGPDDQESYRRQQLGLETQANDWVTMHRDFGKDEEIAPGHYYARGSSDISFRNQYRAWKKYMSEGAC